jgi:RNA polymerase sigma-70 factor, ECF subfamily
VTGAALGDAAASFEPHRRRLMALAYRMLGSRTEAEDAVQETYLRWHRADRAAVTNPPAFLARVVTRLCLDQLKSARVRRETYVGPWLPEPVLDAEELTAETMSDYAHDLSVALMLTLERLSPLERAAFLLHDVFDVDFAEVAATLGRNEAACRQLAARARAHVRSGRPRYHPTAAENSGLLAVFRHAIESGDASDLAAFLAHDVVLMSDGGGRRPAALNPIRGADHIIRLFDGLAAKFGRNMRMREALINGMPGFVVMTADGGIETMALDIADGRIIGIYNVRNPDKLNGVAF